MTILRILLSSPYNFFFVIAIGVAVLLAMREARLRRIPARDWVVLLGVALASGLLGSKLVFLDFRPIAPGEKTIVGAVLVGAVMVLVVARALRIGAWRALDALSVPTLAAMAIGRVGCFLAGCCAGTETGLPWGVRAAGTDAHVHPVQLYEMAADLLLIGVLRRHGTGRWDGARFLAASLGYVVIRLGTESVRAGRGHFAGLTPVQWSLLVLATILGAFAIARARQMAEARPHDPWTPLTARSSALAALGVASGLALTSIVTGTWLVPLERLTVLVIACSLTIAAVAMLMPRGLPRAISVLLAPQAGAILMMQAPADSTPRRELIVGAATQSGTFEQLVGRAYGTDCDGSPTTWPTLARREQHVVEGRVGLRQARPNGDHLIFETRYLGGSDRLRTLDAGPVSTVPAPRNRISALGGSFAFEKRSSFVRLGLTGGDLVRNGEHTASVTPSFHLRAGDDRRWYFQMNLADRRYFPSLGEFSYAGVGFTGGHGRPRMMFGVGEGGIGEVTIPIRRYEVNFGFRSMANAKDGGGGGDHWTFGVQRTFTLRR